MGKVTVIIVNGQPGAGKDTFIDFANQQITQVDKNIFVKSYSSIDIVRDNIEYFGVDITLKTQKDRDLMSNIGDLLEEHSGIRSNLCHQKIASCVQIPRPSVLFLHIREPKLIQKVIDAYKDVVYVDFIRVQIKSDRALNITSNHSDANTDDMEYDFVVNNSGTKGQLYDQATDLLRYARLFSGM